VARTASTRHETLRATLDWSYDLLSTAEQAALRQLAVFPSDFPFDAVEAVIGPDALALLSGLVDKSLVVISDDGEASRYRLLEPVKQYGRERLVEAGEADLAGRRHRDWCLALAARWEGQFSPPERMLRLASEEESFHAALEWSWNHNDTLSSLRLVGVLWHRWMFDGTPWVPEWLERVVAGTSHFDHPARCEVLCGLALTLLPREPGRAMALFQEAASLGDKIGFTMVLAALDFKKSEPALAAGDTARARLLLEKAMGGFESLADEPGIACCHDHLGWVAVADGDHEQARLHFERAAELAARLRHDQLAAQALPSLAALTVLAGEPVRGLGLADEAVAAARRVPIVFILVNALVRAAETALLASEPDRAGEFLVEVLETLSNLGTERYLGDCLELVALTQAALGNAEAAAEMFGAGSARHEAHNETSSARFLAGEAQACQARLSEALGADRFAHHVAHGRALSADMAIARALTGL
jgi:non-specific serine/threonine protein kinase